MPFRLFACSLVFAAALGLAACASAPKPTVVAATLSTALDANPDGGNRASPLMLRVYELSSRATFDSADFVSLFERDKQVLAGDMVAREEWVMAPGETRAWTRKLPPETKFIGITAAYRDIDRAHWRAVVVMQPLATNTLVIRAEGLALSATATAR